MLRICRNYKREVDVDSDVQPTADGPNPTIWRCGLQNPEALLSYVCPMTWDSLLNTENPERRYCGECKRNVYFCTDPDAFLDLADKGECVALPKQLHVVEEIAALQSNAPPTMVMGRPHPKGPWEYEGINDIAMAWWSRIDRRRQRRTYALFQAELEAHLLQLADQSSPGNIVDSPVAFPDEAWQHKRS